MSDHLLRLRLVKEKTETGSANTIRSGKTTALSEETETVLSSCIEVLCKMGFSPTMDEILDIVRTYLQVTNIQVPIFKNSRPGYDWFKAFMRRHNLSLKKVNTICSARK